MNEPSTHPRLTTTSYAILGHLAMQPWTMYELAAQMRRNVHFFYPRAESQVYEEPKRLLKLGLVDARTERTGKRTRTVYEITEAGRAELARWYAEVPARGPILEFEGLLRLAMGASGEAEDLREAVLEAREEVFQIFEVGCRVREEYLAGEAPFQRFVDRRAFLHDLLWRFAELVDDWAERSLERLDSWEQRPPEARRDDGVAVFRELGPERLRHRMERRARRGSPRRAPRREPGDA